jgi:integrase
MKTVQPLRDTKTIDNFKILLRDKSDKYYIMFVIGINTGLRISDILDLCVSDVHGKSHITLTEKKTSKTKRFLINEKLRNEIEAYIKLSGLTDDEYLIKSQKGINRPIQRVQAYKVLNDVARQLDLENVGTHTMRKTFGYWHYKQHKDVAILQEIFNHSAPSVTLKYIGITQDNQDDTIHSFFL